MTSQEIFERLMEYRNDSVRGNDELDGYFDAILGSVGKVLGLSKEQARQLAGDDVEQPVSQPEAVVILNPADYEISDGYVGSWGKTYETATEKTLAKAVAGAEKVMGLPADEVNDLLAEGRSLQWCESPNYYYDHSYGIIRRKRAAAPVALVECSCGHSVPRSQVMSASMGSSCPDCYDRMSN